jgi:hypothetical protein
MDTAIWIGRRYRWVLRRVPDLFSVEMNRIPMRRTRWEQVDTGFGANRRKLLLDHWERLCLCRERPSICLVRLSTRSCFSKQNGWPIPSMCLVFC